MRTGQMRHKIVIQEKTRTADGQGGWTTAWTDTLTLWAKMRAPSGLERIEAMRLTGQVQHYLLVYYDSRVNTRHRVKWHDGADWRYLQIDQVLDPNGMRRHLEIVCHEALED